MSVRLQTIFIRIRNRNRALWIAKIEITKTTETKTTCKIKLSKTNPRVFHNQNLSLSHHGKAACKHHLWVLKSDANFQTEKKGPNWTSHKPKPRNTSTKKTEWTGKNRAERQKSARPALKNQDPEQQTDLFSENSKNSHEFGAERVVESLELFPEKLRALHDLLVLGRRRRVSLGAWRNREVPICALRERLILGRYNHGHGHGFGRGGLNRTKDWKGFFFFSFFLALPLWKKLRSHTALLTT